jgi:hypothetical protein
MSRLTVLRRELKALRRARSWALALGAWSVVLAATVWVLAAVFVLDWCLGMAPAQRLLALGAALAVAVLGIRRVARDAFGSRPSLEEVALWSEARLGLDSDLVAALEFEGPDAERWGSRGLREAVISSAAKRGLDSLRDRDAARTCRRRAGVLLGTLAAAVALIALFPEHARVFFDRLLLSSARYPTRTRIEAIAANGRTVYPPELASGPLRCAHGKPLVVEVIAAGELPERGRLETVSHGGEVVQHELLRQPDTACYRAELRAETGWASLRAVVGDASSDALGISVLPLAVVDVEIEAVPPSYAAARAGLVEADTGGRQRTVLEGSNVSVHVRCANKDLVRVTLVSGEAVCELRQEGAAASGGSRRWRLDPAGTPLERVTEPLSFEVRATDADGLELEEPPRGALRVRADRSPRVVAALVTQRVLPKARPVVTFGVSDDYALAAVRAHLAVLRASGEETEETRSIAEWGDGVRPASVRDRYALDLAPLGLHRGDQVKVTISAQDFRGELAGKSSLSEALVLNVTDERGVLAAMTESDERSARTLDAIIDRQLGIGEPR